MIRTDGRTARVSLSPLDAPRESCDGIAEMQDRTFRVVYGPCRLGGIGP